MNDAVRENTGGMGRHLSMLAVWGLSFGSFYPVHDATRSRIVL